MPRKRNTTLENLKRFISHIREQSALERTEDGLLKFTDEDSDMLFESVANVLNVNQKKERLRDAIKDVFDLEHKDIIIFKQNDIFIKRWGDIPLIPLKLIEKIKEVVLKELEKIESEEAAVSSVTINTQALFQEFGMAPESLPSETKDKIKQRLKERIGLAEKDVVLFLNDKLVVKRFKQQQAPAVEDEEEKLEQKFIGLTKEDLIALKNATFENVAAEEEIVEEIVDKAIESDLNFGKITHDFFIKNCVKILQKSIFDFLKANLKEDSAKLEGLANLLLKEHWMLAHRRMAFSILGLMAQKNPVTESFIKKYSGDIEVDNGQRFKLPEILDKNGAKWNVSSIYGVATQRKKIVDSAMFRQKSIENLKLTIEGLYAKIDELNNDAIQNEKDIVSIDEQIQDRINTEASLNAKIQELGVKLRSTKDEAEKMKIRAEVDEKTLFIKRLLIKGGNLTTEKKRLELLTKQIAAKKEKTHYDIPRMQKRCREDEAEIIKFLASQKEIDEKYDTLVEALALALMKRRTQI